MTEKERKKTLTRQEKVSPTNSSLSFFAASFHLARFFSGLFLRLFLLPVRTQQIAGVVLISVE